MVVSCARMEAPLMQVLISKSFEKLILFVMPARNRGASIKKALK